MKPPVPRGIWLGATDALGRAAPTTEPYPHLCGHRLPRHGHRIRRRDCAACGDHATRTTPRPHLYNTAGLGCCPLPETHRAHQLPQLDDDQRATEARRTGEHD